jgi:hypothetical protein
MENLGLPSLGCQQKNTSFTGDQAGKRLPVEEVAMFQDWLEAQ